MKRVLVIINSRAGTKKKINFEDLITSTLPRTLFELDIRFTEYAGHASELTMNGLGAGYDLFLVVGGDGTVNEVAKHLIDANQPLSIIPCGSGNGLARHLNIPLDPKKALLRILKWNIQSIDTGVCNNRHFLCTAGVGLEAKVARKFIKSKTRGFISYAKIAKKTFTTFSPFKSTTLNQTVVSITIANCNQWGNNTFIAPNASLQDGLFDICSFRPLSLLSAFRAFLQMYFKKIEKFPQYSCSQMESFSDKYELELPVQVDGEFLGYFDYINVTMKPKSLQILT